MVAGCRCQILAQCISLLALDKFLSLFVPQFPHLCRRIRVRTSQGCWRVSCLCVKLQGPAGPHLGSVHLPSIRPWPTSSHSAQCRGLLGPLFPVLGSPQLSHCCSLRLPSPVCLSLMHPSRVCPRKRRVHVCQTEGSLETGLAHSHLHCLCISLALCRLVNLSTCPSEPGSALLIFRGPPTEGGVSLSLPEAHWHSQSPQLGVWAGNLGLGLLRIGLASWAQRQRAGILLPSRCGSGLRPGLRGGSCSLSQS